MKKALRRLFITLCWVIGIFILMLEGLGFYAWKVSDVQPPKLADTSAFALQAAHPEGSLYTIGDNWERRNKWGLYELYVSGAPFERGVKNGKLTAPLITAQEAAFTDQIKHMIPSKGYLRFLKYVVGLMNRGLPAAVPEEYKEEIYGVSHAAQDSFAWVGNKYTRILNYHAAHDIGHALQNMMLVGCTSFGAWGNASADGSMVIGRNFDFWVGDQFAENKIVAFYRPDKGHNFMFVTWGGFTGVVSGMNDKGLTITINAAKSTIPFGAQTPVSLVAREMLQYAGNIDEALKIAHRRKMFVSESFLIVSAADRKAVVVEKTPDSLAVYESNSNSIECTNHYQSAFFQNDKLNQKQRARSASTYRMSRLTELMQAAGPMSPQKAADILRDRRGLGGADIGEGNEKAVNQLLAHHSIIFMPDSLRVWVSTSPWQLGTYVCYDLRKIFAMHGLQHDVEIADSSLNIAPDAFLGTPAFADFMRFRTAKMAVMNKQQIDTAALTRNNPSLYDAYRLAGDYSASKGWWDAAVAYYNVALTKEIATEDERDAIIQKIKRIQKKRPH